MLKKFTPVALALTLACSFNTMAATDVVILIDTSGSTGRLLPNWQEHMKTSVFDVFLAQDPDTRFGLASHIDFPFSPYGGTGEYAYKIASPLTSDTAAVLTALDNMTAGGGGDTKESQLEAIYQAFSGKGLDLNGNGSYEDEGDLAPQSMGWNSDAKTRILIHFTSPLVYHNDPEIEAGYPMDDVVNHPASMLQMLNAQNQLPAIYTFTPDALTTSGSLDTMASKAKLSMASINSDHAQHHYGEKMMSTSSLMFADKGAVVNLREDTSDLTTAEKLALISGGKVLQVSDDLTDLAELVDVIVEKEAEKRGECPVGKTLVELPFARYCI